MQKDILSVAAAVGSYRPVDIARCRSKMIPFLATSC